MRNATQKSTPRSPLFKAAGGLYRLGRATALALFLVAALYLAVTSMLSTTVIVDVETVTFADDFLPGHLLFLAVAVAAVALCHRLLLAADPKKLLLILIGFTLVAGNILIILTRIEPRADQGALMELAHRYVVEGDRSGSEYIARYPQQVGLLLYFMLCTWLSGSGAALLVQSLNVVALCGCYTALSALTGRLFGARRITNLVLVLCFCFFPMLLYVTWVYGNLLSLMLFLLALLCQVIYLQDNRAGMGVLSVLLATLSTVLREGSTVVVIAMVLVYFFYFIGRRRVGALVMGLLCLMMGLFSDGLQGALYAARTGGPVPVGLPPASHIAMGLQRGEYGPGWWDSGILGGHLAVFTNSPQGRAAVAALAGAEIDAALAGFGADPAAAVQFLHDKAASMWCEPTVQGFWIGTSRQSAIPDSPLAQFIYYDTRLGNALLRGFANLLQSLLLAASAAAVWLRRKRVRLLQLLPAIAFLGFFLFHLVWEAKAQYAMSYYALLLPYAAAGLAGLADGAGRLWGSVQKASMAI